MHYPAHSHLPLLRDGIAHTAANPDPIPEPTDASSDAELRAFLEAHRRRVGPLFHRVNHPDKVGREVNAVR